MPQMNKGGKFIFGELVIRQDGLVKFPTQAVEKYGIAKEGKVCLFTGSKSTGGFCMTRCKLLLLSKLGHVLTKLPELLNYKAPSGAFIPYKERAYCWTAISESDEIKLTEGNDGVSVFKARNAVPFHSQQRHSLCYWRKRAAAGESRAF